MSAGGDVDRDALAAALGEHRQSFGSNGTRMWTFCRCNPDVELIGCDGGDWLEVDDPFYVASDEAYLTHVTDALADLMRRTRASALREFADTRGVNVGDEGDEWWSGYRQAQRECLHDAVAHATQIEEQQ